MKWLTSRTARAVAGLAALTLLLLLLDPAETWHVLSHCRPDYVALSLGLMGLVMVIRAHRWWMVSRGIGLPLPFLALLEITFVSNYFNLFLPGSLGGDAYRAYTAARLSDRKLRSVAGVVIERVTGLIALMAVGVVAAVLSRAALPFERELLLGICVAIVLAIAAGYWALCRARPLYRRFQHLLPGFVSSRLPPERWEIILTVAEDVAQRRSTFLASTATGVVLQLVVLTTYYTTSLALGSAVPIHFFFVFFPVIELAGMVPITVNGLGIKEGLVVLFLKLANVPASFSLGLAILNRLLAVAYGLVGGLIWLARRRQLQENTKLSATQAS